MPLASLDLNTLAEHLVDGFAKPLTVDDAKNAVLEAEASLDQVPQQLLYGLGPLGHRLRKAQNLLVVLFSHAHAHDHLLASSAFPVDPGGQEVLLLQRTVLELLKGLLGPLLKIGG